jgi:hypothetical protein
VTGETVLAPAVVEKRSANVRRQSPRSPHNDIDWNGGAGVRAGSFTNIECVGAVERHQGHA